MWKTNRSIDCDASDVKLKWLFIRWLLIEKSKRSLREHLRQRLQSMTDMSWPFWPLCSTLELCNCNYSKMLNITTALPLFTFSYWGFNIKNTSIYPHVTLNILQPFLKTVKSYRKLFTVSMTDTSGDNLRACSHYSAFSNCQCLVLVKGLRHFRKVVVETFSGWCYWSGRVPMGAHCLCCGSFL